MMKNWLAKAGMLVGACTAVGMAGWTHYNGASAAFATAMDGQTTISTSTQYYFEYDLGGNNEHFGLIGAYTPPSSSTNQGIAVYDTPEPNEPNEYANLELQSGWAYVIRPPRWPIVRTPRVRGGVPVASVVAGTDRVFSVAYCDSTVSRVIFLGGVDDEGDPITNCVFDVEALPPIGSTSVQLTVGQYAERTWNPITETWNALTVGTYPVTSTNCPAGILTFIRYVEEVVDEEELPWNENVSIPPASS